jgi:hypothetical protein
MIKLILKINKDYLIYHTLLCSEDKYSSSKYKKDIENFRNYAWKIDKTLYELLIVRLKWLTPFNFENDIFGKIPNYLKTLKQSKYFQKIYQQTENYLKFCQNQWNKNFSKTTQLMSEITGIDFEKENKTFEVYLTHPSLKNGMALLHLIKKTNRNIILFGHNEDWPNYFTVYMWHEILHFYWLKPKDENLSHAIIELATDNELRIRLNGGKYPPFVGHSWLEKIRRKIYPYWKKYLNKKLKVKNIFELEEYILREKIINKI